MSSTKRRGHIKFQMKYFLKEISDLEKTVNKKRLNITVIFILLTFKFWMST